MKKLTLNILLVSLILGACNNSKTNNSVNDTMAVDHTETSDGMTIVDNPKVKPGKYINLTTNEDVNIIEDTVSHLAVDSKTQIPVQFYYDPVTLDTIYQNGLVVNNMLIKEGDGKYRLDDMKIKIDGDKIKIKTDSSKMKTDGDEMKIKDEDGKMKVDGNEVKTKPNN